MDGTSPTPRDESLPVDPWAAQSARREAAARRRRRWWQVGAALAGVLALVASSAWAVRLGGGDGGGAAADPAAPGAGPVADPVADPAVTSNARVATAATPGASIAGTSAVPSAADGDPLTSAKIDEVWLIDRGDGRYEWGARITSRVADDRGPVAIDAALLDEGDRVVLRVDEELRSLAAGATATVGGVVRAPAGSSQRLAVDVAVGDPLEEPAPRPGELRFVAVERRGGDPADGRPDVVAGRLRSSLETELVDIRLAMVWRGELGEVVATVFHDVGRVRPGLDARFEVPVGEDFMGDGPPSEVTWTH